MKIITDPVEMQMLALNIRSTGKRIGFVPTMGALHDGHASLLRLARTQCDILISSIYVNPLQFAANEDLDTYPHTPDSDHAICSTEGVDIVFRPQNIYSPHHTTTVHVSNLTAGLCGGSRPTHFDGVTTVVARLFGLVQPSIAVFGQKDFQQLAVIRQMTQDLALPVEIIGAPIVRETDGLALSSRNLYLSQEARQRALSISHSLKSAQRAIWNGELTVEPLRELMRNELTVDTIDYIEFVHSTTLEPVIHVDNDTRLLIAVFLGSTRLIDNTALTLEKPI